MYEVELKVRADHDAVRHRLDELGAIHRGAVTQVDTYYDAPHRDFAVTDEALRLRSVEPADGTPDEPANGEASTKLTYKGPLVEAASKTREELEVTTPDEETTAEIFQRLGFEPAATVHKDRDRYELDGYDVVLDDVDGLGEFVEVETEASSDSIDAVRDGARATLARLELDPDEQIRTSYLGMLLGDE